MNLLKKPLALLLAALGFASVSQAAVYVDVDLAGPLSYYHLSKNDIWSHNDSYQGTFNILNKGYNPAVERVCDADFWFAFADDSRSDTSEVVKIKVGGLTQYQGDVDGTIWNYDFVWGSVGGSLLATLSNTGILNYTVKILSGDTYLKEAGLIATTCSVPDGGATIALLGMGILGLAAVRRRMTA